MKKFRKLVLVIVISVLALNAVYYMILFSFDNPYIDRFYEKVSDSHNGSIIVGTSRARYAINEDYLDEQFKFKNLSFTVDISPYDSSYLKYIKDITSYKTKNKDRIAIVTIDPYALSIDNDTSNDYFFEYNKNDYKHFNWKYLIKNRLTPIKITEEQINKQMRILFYGDVDNRKINERNIQVYIDNYHKPQINEIALNNLIELITYLKLFSKVYLIRTPITKQFYTSENQYSPNFTMLMDSISKKYEINYYDLNLKTIQSKLEFYDIHHMNSKSSILFTKYIDSLLKRNTNQ